VTPPQQRPQQRPNPVTAPPTWKTINKETRAATDTKFRPLERKEHAELRASKQRERQVGGWWNNYLQTVAQGQQATDAAYAQAGQEAHGFIDQASARDTANTQALQSEAAKSAALRGAAPSTEAASREAAAQGQRNYLSAAYGAKNAAQRANQFAYLGEQKRIGTGQSIASRLEEQRRGRSIGEDLKTVRTKERPEYAVAKRGELTKEARAYKIQRAATGLDKRKAALEEKEARNSNRRANEAQRNANQEQRNQNAAAKGAGGRTPSEVNAAREGRRNAMSAARAFVQAHGWPKTAKEWAGLAILIEGKSEVSPAEAHWAVSKLHQKYGPQIQKGSHEGNRGVPGATQIPTAP